MKAPIAAAGTIDLSATYDVVMKAPAIMIIADHTPATHTYRDWETKTEGKKENGKKESKEKSKQSTEKETSKKSGTKEKSRKK